MLRVYCSNTHSEVVFAWNAKKLKKVLEKHATRRRRVVTVVAEYRVGHLIHYHRVSYKGMLISFVIPVTTYVGIQSQMVHSSFRYRKNKWFASYKGKHDVFPENGFANRNYVATSPSWSGHETMWLLAIAFHHGQVGIGGEQLLNCNWGNQAW